MLKFAGERQSVIFSQNLKLIHLSSILAGSTKPSISSKACSPAMPSLGIV
ncbi:hypothetical protein HPP92_019565 [Vanilla planifolia]|uniref:Uncharacterized protein n=1 Tax=Vanilla planifolia TaxID=51239 RepID=A0A835UL89_VANPL|nr:hypothetical protein HPP92_019565 [Vanilla planifolia]